jgi:hypothetical protein
MATIIQVGETVQENLKALLGDKWKVQNSEAGVEYDLTHPDYGGLVKVFVENTRAPGSSLNVSPVAEAAKRIRIQCGMPAGEMPSTSSPTQYITIEWDGYFVATTLVQKLTELKGICAKYIEKLAALEAIKKELTPLAIVDGIRRKRKEEEPARQEMFSILKEALPSKFKVISEKAGWAMNLHLPNDISVTLSTTAKGVEITNVDFKKLIAKEKIGELTKLLSKLGELA